jgi:hypothetical protein
VKLNGETYWITYYRYDYKVQPNQSAPVYEYVVEKSIGRESVDVCGMDMMGNTVDLGEHEVYAYKTIVTPVNAEKLRGKLTITVWYLSNVSEAFIYPWDVMWMSYMSPTGSSDNDFVGIQFEYTGQTFRMTNPGPFQSGLFPCASGNGDAFSDIGQDLTNLYIGWVATLNFGIWDEWTNTNVLVPQSGAWSDGQGHSWEWNTNPDGSAAFSGIAFKLVDFQWKYEGSPEEVSLDGKGKFSPYLPLLVEGEGHFSYKDEETGKTTVIYAYLKLEDLRLGKVSG